MIKTAEVEDLIRQLLQIMEKLSHEGIRLQFEENGIRWFRDDPATD